MTRSCQECFGRAALVGEQSMGPDRTRLVYECESCGALGVEDYDRGRFERTGCLARKEEVVDGRA